MMVCAQASPFFPLPARRGEGAEDRRSEAGEGLPLTRLASLATLSPQKRGEGKGGG